MPNYDDISMMADRPSRPIVSEVERLIGLSAQLSESIDNLINALHPVLMPMPPTEASVNGKHDLKESASPLSEQLRQIAEQLKYLESRVGQTRHRLEV